MFAKLYNNTTNLGLLWSNCLALLGATVPAPVPAPVAAAADRRLTRSVRHTVRSAAVVLPVRSRSSVRRVLACS